jgi:peptidoglycan/xylan/chitin deacetylase (PgdA/CDA1 family)
VIYAGDRFQRSTPVFLEPNDSGFSALNANYQANIKIMKTIRKTRFSRGIRLIQQQLEPPNTPKAIILMYHRICDDGPDPLGLAVTPEHFQQHLQVLEQIAQPISLPQLVQAYRSGTIPDRAVAITLDDGYADNLHQATPLLEQFHIPATVFVATGRIGNHQNAWYDELAWLLLSPSQLPQQLQLTIQGRQRRWSLSPLEQRPLAEEVAQEAAQDSAAPYPHRSNAWRSGAEPRLGLYHSVFRALWSLPEVARASLMQEIQSWSHPAQPIPVLHRSLTEEELRVLSSSEVIDIGAHTVTHPHLSSQPSQVQRAEIYHSKADLEAWLGQPVKTFAYPYGDYNLTTSSLLQQAGFDCACTTVKDVLHQGADCFQLPRFEVKDYDGQVFERQLNQWFSQSPVEIIRNKILPKSA